MYLRAMTYVLLYRVRKRKSLKLIKKKNIFKILYNSCVNIGMSHIILHCVYNYCVRLGSLVCRRTH